MPDAVCAATSSEQRADCRDMHGEVTASHDLTFVGVVVVMGIAAVVLSVLERTRRVRERPRS